MGVAAQNPYNAQFPEPRNKTTVTDIVEALNKTIEVIEAINSTGSQDLNFTSVIQSLDQDLNQTS